MTYMGNLTTGDRVRVTFEADVRFGTSFGVDLEVGGGVVSLREETWPGVKFERIEPPVETFQPGDVVRHKNEGGTYVIVEGGFVPLHDEHAEKGTREYLNMPFEFTSEHYEKVALDG